MPNQGEAHVLFQGASVEVFVTDEDVRQYMALGHRGEDHWSMLKDIAYEKARNLGVEGVRVDVESPQVLDDSIGWDALEGRTASRREAADANPTTRQASDALKIAKTLSGLLNDLAGLDQTSREQIAQAAGLQQLPESIDRLYELADQLRMGGITNLQVPQQPVAASYDGWDPERLRSRAKSFVDTEARPAETIVDPAERFQAPNQKASDAHAPEADIEK